MEERVLVYFESLGCDKNLVDSEVMLGMLNEKGFVLTMDPGQADAIVINTCSFIHDAKEESVNAILELAELKHTGKLKALVVVGCLTQLYQEEVMKEIEEVDAILGAANYDRIVEAINEALIGRKYMEFDTIDHTSEPFINRTVETTKHYAYLKIAEGCDNHCTYCIIPKLRGKFRSRTIDSLMEEVDYLTSMGKTEIILVAQDVGKYGLDIYGERKLPELMKKINAHPDVKWIRLLYVYPEDVTDELITAMATMDKVLHYIDMPLQHIDDAILKKMARKSRMEDIVDRIATMRKAIPDICIRTTFIVGFPGETQEHFDTLYDFVVKTKLDRVGVFTYSREEGTPAYNLPDQIDEATSIIRQEKIMLAQQKISTDKNAEMIGKELTAIIDAYVPDDEVYLGRTYKDTPDVDSYVFIESEDSLMSGDYVKIRVTGSNEYDLIGEVI